MQAEATEAGAGGEGRPSAPLLAAYTGCLLTRRFSAAAFARRRRAMTAPDLIEAKIRQDVFTAVKGSWMTWIPAHTINFAFVPSDMRLLYINTIQIFFNMFMSVIGNTEAVAAE